MIFPDNTRKIIFQCDFFGKTIFSKHLEKENMVFRAVLAAILRMYNAHIQAISSLDLQATVNIN